VKYVDEKFVNKLGEICIAHPSSASPASATPTPTATPTTTPGTSVQPFVVVRFQFGKIDFNVEAKDYMGNKCTAKMSFASTI
jgi:hypothetical protein